MFIPISYIGDTMGRQKTLYIDEACWQKLEQMGDDPLSHKVRRCIMLHDTAVEARIDALRTQIDHLKQVLIDNDIEGWWMD